MSEAIASGDFKTSATIFLSCNDLSVLLSEGQGRSNY